MDKKENNNDKATTAEINRKKDWAARYIENMRYVHIREEERRLTRRILELIGQRRGFETASCVHNADYSSIRFVRNIFWEERCSAEVTYNDNKERIDWVRSRGITVFQISQYDALNDEKLTEFVLRIRDYIGQVEFYRSGKSVCSGCRNLIIDRHCRLSYMCKRYGGLRGIIEITTSCEGFSQKNTAPISDSVSIARLRKEEHARELNQKKRQREALEKIGDLNRVNPAADRRCLYCGHRFVRGGETVCPMRKAVVNANDTCSEWASNALRKDRISKHNKEPERQCGQNKGAIQPTRGARPSKNK